jgi:2-desacetyl-2-hydroxyethyl bacteriochlorophyllide A dehydrogenase
VAVKSSYIVIAGPRNCEVRCEDIDRWRLRDTEAIVMAEASLISCGTELNIYEHASDAVGCPGAWDAYPWRAGSCIAGQVLEVGRRLRREYAPGDRVLCFGHHAAFQFCDLSGSAPDKTAVKLPRNEDARRAIAARMLRVARLATDCAALTDHQRVAVVGLGILGNLTAQWLMASGHDVIAFGRPGARLEAALACGINAVGISSADSANAEAQTFSTVIDAGGRWSSLARSVDLCRRSGRVVMAGKPREPASRTTADAVLGAQRKSLTLIGAHEWGRAELTAARVRAEIESALEAITSGAVRTEALISHSFAPEAAPRAYEALSEDRNAYVGVLFRWSGGANRSPSVPGHGAAPP